MKPDMFTNKEKAEILTESKKDHPGHVVKRLLVLKLRAIDGLSSAQAGDLAGFHRTSVDKLVNRYKAEGIEAVIGKRHNHGNRYMTLEEEVAFLDRFRARGRSGVAVDVTDIHRAFQAAVGREVTRSAIYYLLKKHNWKRIAP